ncbi:MAG: hypothetical protein ACRDMW_05180, partial [Gaiellaceae bacterium]
MGETTSRILLFALVAGVSPIAIVSTLAVLTSRRGRTNGVVLVAGFMLLGVGGVKRLTVTIVAGATVGIASLQPAEEVALAVLYLLVGG